MTRANARIKSAHFVGRTIEIAERYKVGYGFVWRVVGKNEELDFSKNIYRIEDSDIESDFED